MTLHKLTSHIDAPTPGEGGGGHSRILVIRVCAALMTLPPFFCSRPATADYLSYDT